MAIVRCDEHPVQGNRAKNTYVMRVEPVGYPATAARCGRRGCENPGYIWLKKDEHYLFTHGIRHFILDTELISVMAGEVELPLPDSYEP